MPIYMPISIFFARGVPRVRLKSAKARAYCCNTVPGIMRNNISEDLEPHFQTSATKSWCLGGIKNAVALPHCSESTRESIAAGWWTFGLEVTLELWRNITEYRTYQKTRRDCSRCEIRPRFDPPQTNVSNAPHVGEH